MFLVRFAFALSLAAQQATLNDAMRLASVGDFPAAARILSQLTTADPQNPELRYRFGLVLLRQNKLDDAAIQLEAAVANAPANPLVWLAVAQLRLQQSQLDAVSEAASKASQFASADPNVARALSAIYSRLAHAWRAAQNPAKAVDAWQSAIRHDPAQPAHYAALAQLFLDHRTPEPALAVLAGAVQRFPADTSILRLYGLAQYATGDTAAALETFLRVVDLAPDNEEHYASLETLLPDAGPRIPEIQRRLRGFLTRRPSSAVGLYLLALTAPAESEKLLRAAIHAEPEFWPAYYELHKPLLDRAAYREAADLLQRAATLNPTHAPTRYALAQIYLKLGDRQRAADERRAHHQLLLAARKAAEQRQQQMQRLPYKLSPQ